VIGDYKEIASSNSAEYKATANGWYFVEISNFCFSGTKALRTVPVQVLLNIPPVFENVNFPANVSVCVGTPSYKYEVYALDAWKYEWALDGIHKLDFITGPVYTIENANFEKHAGVYTVKATGGCPNAFAITNPSRFWVADVLQLPIQIMHYVDLEAEEALSPMPFPSSIEQGKIYYPTIGHIYGYEDITNYTWTTTGNVDSDFLVNEGEQLNTVNVLFKQIGTGTLNVKMMHVCGDQGNNNNVYQNYNRYYTAAQALNVVKPADDVAIPSVEAQRIGVFPNPVGNEMTVAAKDAIQAVKVTDINGRLLFSKENAGANMLQIKAEDWAKGTYVVTVTTLESNGVFKVIKK
jgi:hypothetical protein